MIENLLQTSMLLLLVSIIAIKSHGDIDPPYWIKSIEVSLVIFSGGLAFVCSLALIWQ